MTVAEKTEKAEPAVAELLANPKTTIAEFVEARRHIHTALTHRSPVEKLIEKFDGEIGKKLPSENASLTRRGVLYWLLNSQERAIEILESVRSSPERNFFLGHSYLELDRPSRAIEALQSAYEADRDEIHGALAFAEAALGAGRAEEADKAISRLEKNHSDQPDVLYLRGLHRERTGDLYEGLDLYEKALEADPGHARSLFKIAYLLDLKGEDAKALELYHQLRKMQPLHLHTMINLGVIYEDRGDFDKAMACYQAILDYYPNHARAKLYLEDAKSSLNMYFDEDAAKKEARQKLLLGQNLADFQWSRRVREAFNKIGVGTVGDLVSRSEEELLEIPNFGRTSLNEVKEFLQTRGLTLSYSAEGGASPLAGLDANAKLLSDIPWSARVPAILEKAEIKTAGDLAAMTESQLREVKGAGDAVIEEIKEKLGELGLSLRAE